MANASLFFETDTNLSMASLFIRHSSYFPSLRVRAGNEAKPTAVTNPAPVCPQFAPRAVPSWYRGTAVLDSLGQLQFCQLRPSETIVTDQTKVTSENYVYLKKTHNKSNSKKPTRFWGECQSSDTTAPVTTSSCERKAKLTVARQFKSFGYNRLLHN
jgi:hypothetical protein